MKIAIIGRTQILFETMFMLKKEGYDISCILTSKEAPEYTKVSDDFKQIAKDWNIPFAKGAKILEHTEFLSSSNSDIALSLNYNGIIPQSIIDLFPMGILNAHGGDLPRYRGNACQAWAILNGEEKIGLCIHKMIGGELDSGDIIAKEFLKIDINTKVTQVWGWMSTSIPKLFLESVKKMSDNPSFVLEEQSKNSKEISRCFPLNPSDGLINWSKSSTQILRQINAHNKPYSGAFSSINKEKVIIWDAELVDIEYVYYAVPGQIIKIDEGYIQVACGEGQIKISLIEIDNSLITPDKYVKSIRTRFK